MPNVNVNQTFFKTLSGSFEIAAEDNVIGFSVNVVDGTCSITGAGSFRGESSGTVELVTGGSYTESANPYSVLGSYVFEVSGTTIISIKQ